jgi:hypothetical protein
MDHAGRGQSLSFASSSSETLVSVDECGNPSGPLAPYGIIPHSAVLGLLLNLIAGHKTSLTF